MQLNKLSSYNEKNYGTNLFHTSTVNIFLTFRQTDKSCSVLVFSNTVCRSTVLAVIIQYTWVYLLPSWLKVYSSHFNIFASSDFRFKIFLVIISLCLESRWPNQEFPNKCVIVCSFAVGLLFFKARNGIAISVPCITAALHSHKRLALLFQ